MKPSQYRLRTVALLVRPAQLAHAAGISDWLEASALSDLQVRDLVADLDDDTSTLVARTPGTLLRHRAQAPVVRHEVQVTVADTSGIYLDQDLVGLDLGHRDHLYFDAEVWALVDDDAGFAFFGDVEGGGARAVGSHDCKGNGGG